MAIRTCGPILGPALFWVLLFCFTVPRIGAAAIRQIEITGRVDFTGCPSAISCSSFPLMWGVSGGEAVTARLVYEDDSPLAFLDDAAPDHVSARYDHTLPLTAPLGMRLQFGPYSATAGSGGAPADRYAIHLFDDLNSTCCPDLSESVAVEMVVPPFSFSMSAPPGYHDLDLRVVRLDFLNYSGVDDLLNGAALPPDFAELAWEDIRLTVDVYDPIHEREGRAFLKVESLQSTLVPAIPTLSEWGLIAVPILLLAAVVWTLRQREAA